MMLDATQNHAATLTADRLCAWHAALFPTGRSGLHRITVGAWRTASAGPMQVVSGPLGRERVHFEAPAAARLDVEMQRFLDWFNAPSDTDPVLKAGIAHLWFLTIHPFEDGNGRIARALGDLLLARADGTKARFLQPLHPDRIRAQAVLRRAWKPRNAESSTITGWLAWFLGCLDCAIRGAETSLAKVLRKAQLWHRVNARPVNDRQRNVLNRMLGDFRGHLTTSKYAKFAGCSSDTALRDVRDLLERGVLVQNPGGGRSTSYRLAEPGERKQ